MGNFLCYGATHIGCQKIPKQALWTVVESESIALIGAASLGKFVVSTYRLIESKPEVLGCDWMLCTVESEPDGHIERVSFGTTGIDTL